MSLYDFPTIVFTVPHVKCLEEKSGGVICHEAPKNVHVTIAELGVDKPILLVCDTVDGSYIEDPPSVIAQFLLGGDLEVNIETFSSMLKVRFLLGKTQTFNLTFSASSEFWDFIGIVAEIQSKKIDNQTKEEELVRGVFGMVPNVPRVFKQEE
ncbi:hypothetical protein GSI_08512 [Ganoderma sinense ZZ0214-1]|uniref:Uncharacterized protein n=1 Tax=Ganoderma sinense ZZ0214-1 TaxID=1077348 RepID=A0A2G8S414_9APHY|nr:hypothetical protein GSI_08512 [Ganoderma sinense ZZ0214-1]